MAVIEAVHLPQVVHQVILPEAVGVVLAVEAFQEAVEAVALVVAVDPLEDEEVDNLNQQKITCIIV